MAEAEPEEGGRGTRPPYVAYQTLKTFLQNLKPHKLPGRIDRSLLGNFAGSVQAQLITSLRFLGLIDAKGHPTDRLAELLRAYDTEHWSEELGRLLRDRYQPMFEIELSSASPAQFNERFRSAFPGAEEVVRKSMTFFLNASRDAKIEISPHILRNKKPRVAGSTSRRRTAARTGTSAQRRDSTATADPLSGSAAPNSDNGAAPRAPNSFELLAAFDPSDMNEDEQKAVWTLIQYLRRKEVTRRTSQQRRQKPGKTAASAATAQTEEVLDGPP